MFRSSDVDCASVCPEHEGHRSSLTALVTYITSLYLSLSMSLFISLSLYFSLYLALSISLSLSPSLSFFPSFLTSVPWWPLLSSRWHWHQVNLDRHSIVSRDRNIQTTRFLQYAYCSLHSVLQKYINTMWFWRVLPLRWRLLQKEEREDEEARSPLRSVAGSLCVSLTEMNVQI